MTLRYAPAHPDGTVFLESKGLILPPARSGVTLSDGRRLLTDAVAFRGARSGKGWSEIDYELESTGARLTQRVEIPSVSRAMTLELILRAGREPLAVDRLHHLVFDAVSGEPSAFEPGKGLSMWRFGTLSPGDPVLFIPLDSPDIPRTVDCDRWLIEEKDRVGFTAEMLALFRSRPGGPMCLVGFATLADQACGFLVTRVPGRLDTIHFESRCDLEGLTLAPGEEARSEKLLILAADDPWRAVERYAEEIAKRYPPRPVASPLTGWSDWQYYRRGITEADVMENLDALAREKYPVDVILIDDGFQRNMSDWLVPNERFPHGIQWLAERIREKGFKPGIWIAPLTAHESSEMAREHRDWLVHDRSGAPLARDTHMGKVYALDFTVPEAAAWLRALVRTLVKDYGYRWVKLDGPIRRYYDRGVFRKPMTSVQHIRLALSIIREEAGDAIVEGEGYYGPSLGLVDTQRVTQDIQQDWQRLKHTAQVNLLSTFMHRRWWINNPDAFILRDEPTPAMTVDGVPEHVMTGDELQTEISALALSGGVVMLTDRMASLKPERKALVDAFLPVWETPAAPIDLFNGDICPAYFRQEVRDYEVFAAFNWDDSARAMRIPRATPGCGVAFEFWTQAFLGEVSESIDVGVVPAHGVRLVAVRRVLDRPFVMGTSVHVTQGGVELSGETWDASRNELSFVVTSWAKTKRTAHVYVPDGFVPERPLAGPNHLALEFDGGGTAQLRAAFRLSSS